MRRTWKEEQKLTALTNLMNRAIEAFKDDKQQDRYRAARAAYRTALKSVMRDYDIPEPMIYIWAKEMKEKGHNDYLTQTRKALNLSRNKQASAPPVEVKKRPEPVKGVAPTPTKKVEVKCDNTKNLEGLLKILMQHVPQEVVIAGVLEFVKGSPEKNNIHS